MTTSGKQAAARSPDPEAIELARWVHRASGSRRTYLFGSRARGDHRPDSDIDLLIIGDTAEDEQWMEELRKQARTVQKEAMKEASGIDVLYMTRKEFQRGRRLINNLAYTIAKEGVDIMSDERLVYNDHPGYDDEDDPEEDNQEYDNRYDNIVAVDYNTDWQDVDVRNKDATDYADSIEVWLEIDTQFLERQADKPFGHTAQQALENGYKAVLGAHGLEYPTSGRDGHNLRLLITQIRRDLDWPEERLVPGENHQYLTAFGGAQLYAHEHLPLDKLRIAREVPEAVRELQQLVTETERRRRPADS